MNERSTFPWATIVVLVLLIAGGVALWTWWPRASAAGIETVTPRRATIERSVRANGSIAPRIEVAIKPQVSGVVERLAVEAGDVVAVGALLAVIRPQPDPDEVNRAEDAVDLARLELEQARRDHTRTVTLHRQQIVPTDTVERRQTDLALAERKLTGVLRALEIARTGAAGNAERPATEVRATIAGTVLERPVEVGGFVIETNTFNEGTTIAVLADMNDLVFNGQVDEADAGRLTDGQTLALTVGALPDKPFPGRLEFIAPKSVDRNGLTVFRIRAGLTIPAGMTLRAGYSATGVIVTDRRNDVLVVEERWLHFDRDTPWVELVAADGATSRRDLRLGLSDGLVTEVLDGLTGDERLTVP